MKKRAAIIVLDSVGIGAMPDAGEFGDAGAHTLGNINAARPLNIPNLTALGIGNIENSRLPRTDAPTAAFGRAAEVTKAKDTTSGHWEMAGLAMKTPFRTYPNGFPKALMEEFERKIGRGTLGNKVGFRDAQICPRFYRFRQHPCPSRKAHQVSFLRPAEGQNHA